MHHLQSIHHIHPLQKFFHRSCGAFLHRICDIEVLIQQRLYRSYYTGVVESLHRSSLLGDLLASELLQDKTPTSQVLLKHGGQAVAYETHPLRDRARRTRKHVVKCILVLVASNLVQWQSWEIDLSWPGVWSRCCRPLDGPVITCTGLLGGRWRCIHGAKSVKKRSADWRQWIRIRSLLGRWLCRNLGRANQRRGQFVCAAPDS